MDPLGMFCRTEFAQYIRNLAWKFPSSILDQNTVTIVDPPGSGLHHVDRRAGVFFRYISWSKATVSSWGA